MSAKTLRSFRKSPLNQDHKNLWIELEFVFVVDGAETGASDLTSIHSDDRDISRLNYIRKS